DVLRPAARATQHRARLTTRTTRASMRDSPRAVRSRPHQQPEVAEGAPYVRDDEDDEEREAVERERRADGVGDGTLPPPPDDDLGKPPADVAGEDPDPHEAEAVQQPPDHEVPLQAMPQAAEDHGGELAGGRRRAVADVL